MHDESTAPADNIDKEPSGSPAHSFSSEEMISRDLLLTVLETAPAAIGMVRERVFVWVNDGMERMTGYSREELFGREARMLYNSLDEFERVGEVKYRDIRETGQGEVDTVWKRKDGNLIDIHLRSSAINPSKPSLGVIFTAIEQTEQLRTVRELSEARERIGNHVRLAPYGIFITDSNGMYRFLNEEARRMSGLTDREAMSHGLHSIRPECARDRAMELLEQSRISGASEGEISFTGADGHPKTWLVKSVKLPGDEFMAFCRDVTSSRIQTESISHLNRILHGVRGISKLILTETDRHHLLQEACRILVAERGFLYAWIVPEENTGDLPSFIHSGVGEVEVQRFSDILSQGYLPQCVLSARKIKGVSSSARAAGDCPDCPLKGGEYAGQTSLTSELRYRDRCYGYLSASVPTEFADLPEEIDVFREVADTIAVALNRLDLEDQRRRSEILLRESEERFRTFMESVPVAIFLKDSSSRYLYTNNFLSERHDPNREWIGRETTDCIPDEWGLHLLESDQAVLRNGISNSRQELKDIAGNIRTYQVHKFRIGSEGRYQIGGIALDITDELHAEVEKKKLEEQLLHTQKLESLGVLAGGIAHDFNNILMAVLGYADLALLDLSPGDPARSSIIEIEKAARNAADLARQMLAYSGRGSFIIEKISINEIVRDMTHLLGITISKNAVIKYHLAENLPAVKADPTQMRQVIMNLITNASEAMEESSGVISVTTSAMECDSDYLSTAFLNEDLPEGLYVYFEVADTGSGMDPETAAKMFDPFFTSKFTGRGLGLSAVLGIVRGHKGALKVYTEQGSGTSFKILLPACLESMTEEAEASVDKLEQWVPDAGTILLVDDEEDVRSIGKAMLERVGFTVITACDGREALSIFREDPDSIACVILDLTMPHMDGTETFREMHRVQSDVRVILSSGYNEQDVTGKFVGKHLAGFIQKPYRMQDLLDKLKEVLS